MSSLNNAVNVDQLKFAYASASARPVLDISRLQIARSEHVFMYGPSGSGKTTLLGILAGLLNSSSGKVELLGQDLSKLSSHGRDKFRGTHIGYIFQMFNLIPYLSVVENIVLPCRLNKSRAARVKTSLDEDARRLCNELGIGAIVERRVTDLSVGQQQRVAAARALIGAPEIIIADEPTSALDMEHREHFLRLLFQEANQTKSTVIFVSHDQSLKHLFPRSLSLPELNRVQVATSQSSAVGGGS